MAPGTWHGFWIKKNERLTVQASVLTLNFYCIVMFCVVCRHA